MELAYHKSSTVMKEHINRKHPWINSKPSTSQTHGPGINTTVKTTSVGDGSGCLICGWLGMVVARKADLNCKL